MKYIMILRQSLKAIFANKGRSFLTVLGIIIGIGSVIALISMGNGVQAEIDNQIKQLGTNTLTIMPGASRFSQPESTKNGAGFSGGSQSAREGAIGSVSTLSEEDLLSLSDTTKHPAIKYVNGNISGTAIIPTTSGDLRAAVTGGAVSFFPISGVSIEVGREYTQAEVDAKANVAVLGHQTYVDIYGSDNAIGKKITIAGAEYEVVGVMATKDESGFQNYNDGIYIPYTSAIVSFKTSTFNAMRVESTSDKTVEAAKEDIVNTLLANHKITDPKLADFTVMSSKDLLTTVSSITGVLTSLLAGIAAISLVVGGIGIMNIMLVSVTERTREIGLRKAVGAKTSDILLQFIVEAIILTLVGGLLGIGLGYLIGLGAANFLEFTPIVTPQAILLAVGVSSAVGLVFGIYPAAKAARLNPIDALRYE